MVKYYNGEMYTIPIEFEEETRADERKKVLNEAISRISDLRDNEYDERDEFHNIGIDHAIAELEQMKGEQS